MASLSNERIQEMKDLLEQKKGTEVTWGEASEAAHNLAGLAEIMFESWREDQWRKKKLKESPKGFILEGSGYSCFICGSHTSENENWYDKFGIKCMVCQKAIDKKIIPGSAAKNKESWYSKWDLESRFNINHHALRSFIKKGILKPRIVPGPSGKPHAYLFFIKDNKDTLPPKELTESRSVVETKDGKNWYHSEPWYRFEDPYILLKDYKIMNHLRVVNA